MFCVWKALVTNWWPGVYLVQRYLPGAICIQCDHAGLVCAYQKQPKICMKWGQRMLMISVHLVDQTGVQCNPGRGTATHAATRYSLTSWLTIPKGDTGLQHSCGSRAHRQALEQLLRARSPICWTLNPGSGQSYCSFSSHTNSNSALMKYILRASGWTHSTKLYPNIKICFHGILEQLADTMNYFVFLYVHFCKWNLCRDFMCECIKMLLRPVDCAIICPKRRSLCSITIS